MKNREKRSYILYQSGIAHNFLKFFFLLEFQVKIFSFFNFFVLLTEKPIHYIDGLCLCTYYYTNTQLEVSNTHIMLYVRQGEG